MRSLAAPPRAPSVAPPDGTALLPPRLVVLAVLVASVGLEDGPTHAHAHWVLLALYGATTLAFAAREPAGWAGVLLDAGLAAYVVVEHVLVTGGSDAVVDVVSQTPAYLLLLVTALSNGPARTLAFACVVAAGWIAGFALSARLGASPVVLAHQAFAILAFAAASAFVTSGVVRLRRAVAATVRAERERAFLSRFVQDGMSARGEGGLRLRHACLLMVDVRGFSALTRRHDPAAVARWLLLVRATVHACVAEQGGVVDKYVGDAVLAQFFGGSPRAQAEAAVRAVIAARARLDAVNAERVGQGLPALRLVHALHAGEVLAGVLDDGLRAELTVLGAPMNALARIERRAKGEGVEVLASKRFARLLAYDRTELDARRLPRRADEADAPDVVVLDTIPGGRAAEAVTETHA